MEGALSTEDKKRDVQDNRYKKSGGKESLWFMILRNCSVLFTSRAIPTLQKCNVLSGNRAISTFHAIFITVISLYLVFCSDLYSDYRPGLIIFRSSSLSTFALGVSVGYFIVDLGMIIWFYPFLGDSSSYFHDCCGICYVDWEGQLYIYMVLISETTTPGINLRWYLDTAGMKRSRAYLINGVVIFLAWLVARILLFIYFFYHVYLHYDQVTPTLVNH
ncbi:hypothetical protein GH714_014950 [Hevea brasiliensis]|uniref:TLC domain-containing protein n=1 Tax=Hevea brasiliensis TaxID=3981 RepID=A0A6A6KQ64_HEVBR|nr:hypothetical protein GH714_014950 [Hevea brasiliensis]